MRTADFPCQKEASSLDVVKEGQTVLEEQSDCSDRIFDMNTDAEHEHPGRSAAVGGQTVTQCERGECSTQSRTSHLVKSATAHALMTTSKYFPENMPRSFKDLTATNLLAAQKIALDNLEIDVPAKIWREVSLNDENKDTDAERLLSSSQDASDCQYSSSDSSKGNRPYSSDDSSNGPDFSSDDSFEISCEVAPPIGRKVPRRRHGIGRRSEITSEKYIDKLPSYYTVLSLPARGLTHHVQTSADIIVGSSGLPRRDRDPSPDRSNPVYNKLPSYHSCFTNSTKYDTDNCTAWNSLQQLEQGLMERNGTRPGHFKARTRPCTRRPIPPAEKLSLYTGSSVADRTRSRSPTRRFAHQVTRLFLLTVLSTQILVYTLIAM